MDRMELEAFLGQGLSLAEIGRRCELHESTVGYWVEKHGLVPVNRDAHAAKGRLDRAELARFVEAGMSSGQIAERTGRSKTTVRHWLREFGLATQWTNRRQASSEGRQRMLLRCSRHGMTPFARRRSGGYRCNKCRAEAVSRRRRKVKQVLVQEAGGACRLCGYDRCVAALEFHHLVPAEKRFSLSHRGVTRSMAAAREEAARCVLLCANCHAEVEAGVAAVAESNCARIQCDPSPDLYPG